MKTVEQINKIREQLFQSNHSTEYLYKNYADLSLELMIDIRELLINLNNDKTIPQ